MHGLRASHRFCAACSRSTPLKKGFFTPIKQGEDAKATGASSGPCGSAGTVLWAVEEGVDRGSGIAMNETRVGRGQSGGQTPTGCGPPLLALLPTGALRRSGCSPLSRSVTACLPVSLGSTNPPFFRTAHGARLVGLSAAARGRLEDLLGQQVCAMVHLAPALLLNSWAPNHKQNPAQRLLFYAPRLFIHLSSGPTEARDPARRRRGPGPGEHM
jgi:hypothetical protein